MGFMFAFHQKCKSIHSFYLIMHDEVVLVLSIMHDLCRQHAFPVKQQEKEKIISARET
jgi:hypothetical protein